MTKYSKMAATILATIITAIVGYLTDGAITSVEWVNVAVAAVTAAGVFAAPNVPGSKYTKAILAVLGTVLVFLTSAITDGISVNEWLQVLVLALGAVGVYAVPNTVDGVNISDTGAVGERGEVVPPPAV